MAKITLSSIPSGYATAAAHNADNTAIATAIENTLSRDGTSPNQMNANLDMNGYAILNQRATSGANFIWMGTWTTGTSYSVNNLVYAPEGTNIGNTLICVVANTAGATLDGDAAKWAVFAQRGAPGAAGGDVQGPASSTADSLARYNGTTGKLLKDGAIIGTDIQAYSTKLTSFATNTLTAANKIPYATALNTAAELTLDTDIALTANSDTTIATQKAIKTYIDSIISVGTWTPAFTFSTPGNLSVLYTIQNGTYTKIGNLVVLQFTAVTSTFTHTTASGDFRITGLPFAANNTANTEYAGEVSWGGISKASYTDASLITSPSSSYLRVQLSGSGQPRVTISTTDIASGSTVSFIGTIIYSV